MRSIVIYPRGVRESCAQAALILEEKGFAVTDHPSQEVTHLLLDVPSFGPGGQLPEGGDLSRILEMLPPDITVIGGNLNAPQIQTQRKLDLLQIPEYLAQNAAITAQCAIAIAAPLLPVVFSDAPTLVIGWGRIGKCLCRLLRGLGCPVTVAARKPADRAMAQALGWKAVELSRISEILPGIRLIFNTVPAPVVSPAVLEKSTAVKIELASVPGLPGPDVISARGLPGRCAPESSGRLMAQIIAKCIKEGNS